VKGLPHWLAVGATVEPVREPAAAVAVEACVGQDDDQRQPGGGLLGVAEGDPVRRTATGTVEEVEDRVPPLRILGVAVGEENPDVDGALQRRGCNLHVELTGVELPERLDVNPMAVTELDELRRGDGRARSDRRQDGEQRDVSDGPPGSGHGGDHPAATGARASAMPVCCPRGTSVWPRPPVAGDRSGDDRPPIAAG